MMRRSSVSVGAWLLVSVLSVLHSTAAVPARIPFQGLVKEGGVPYTGTGYFKFAIFVGGVVGWQNFQPAGAGDEPGKAVPLSVVAGRFAVYLGDSTVPNMNNLDPSIFSSAPTSTLRIWFGTNAGGPFEQLSPDQAIGTVPYAFLAGLAAEATTVPDAAITSAKLATSLTIQSLQVTSVSGNGSGLTSLNPNALASGTVSDSRLSANIPRLDLSQTFLGANVFSDHLRIGTLVNTAVQPAGYGRALILSGAPDVSVSYNNDNSDPLWLARYNVGENASELRINVGDDSGSTTDRLVVGTTATGGPDFSQTGTWTPKFSVDANGTAKMGPNAEYFALGGFSHVRVIGGTVRSDGTISKGSGFTITKTATGTYRIDFARGFSGGSSTVASPNFAASAKWNIQSGASVLITMHNSAGALVDDWFNFITLGFE